eukprot:gnl/TRDRNA2_/TRDRNA2_197173_c0_seq1.p1 gnl/TRDRNA2_/TRDRNA2_197173_c0~~gnl/TRDRNA2_/TRDRNA2_197173_c0_seq1.p1  ORF type:complete len:275 (+),score=40.00 gnl/TRDRNA2_/TRDRNA2_197173_c0_seq1:142-966(+)
MLRASRAFRVVISHLAACVIAVGANSEANGHAALSARGVRFPSRTAQAACRQPASLDKTMLGKFWVSHPCTSCDQTLAGPSWIAHTRRLMSAVDTQMEVVCDEVATQAQVASTTQEASKLGEREIRFAGAATTSSVGDGLSRRQALSRRASTTRKTGAQNAPLFKKFMAEAVQAMQAEAAEIQRKQDRLSRFDETVDPDERMKVEAVSKRFGRIVDPAEVERQKARAKRFGLAIGEAASVKGHRVINSGNPVDAEEEEKRQQRANRFKKTSVTR